MFLIRLVVLPVRLGVKTTGFAAKTGYRTGRLLGYRRIFVLGVGIAIGMLIAPVPGRQLRERLAKLLEQFGGPPSTTEAAATADIARYPYGGIRYEASADLPSLGGDAPVYKLDGLATTADVERIEKAFGMSGTVLANEVELTAVDGDQRLSIENE